MSDDTPTPPPPPGLTQRIIARLRGKPTGTVEERAAKAQAGARRAVQKVSDPNVSGAIERRKQLYENVYQQTKDE